jgi:hypothetical protein
VTLGILPASALLALALASALRRVPAWFPFALGAIGILAFLLAGGLWEVLVAGMGEGALVFGPVLPVVPLSLIPFGFRAVGARNPLGLAAAMAAALGAGCLQIAVAQRASADAALYLALALGGGPAAAAAYVAVAGRPVPRPRRRDAAP